MMCNTNVSKIRYSLFKLSVNFCAWRKSEASYNERYFRWPGYSSHSIDVSRFPKSVIYRNSIANKLEYVAFGDRFLYVLLYVNICLLIVISNIAILYWSFSVVNINTVQGGLNFLIWADLCVHSLIVEKRCLVQTTFW